MPKIIENLETRLMEEARKQIEDDGYSAMTIRTVAKECGVGVGTVYNYFPSKDALLAAYLLRDWKECIEIIQSTSDCAESQTEVLSCIYHELLCYAQRHQSIFRDESATAAFAGSFSQYHSLLRSQIAAPLRKFCQHDFAAEFIAESLLTWTMAGKSFEEINGMLKKLF